MSRKVKILKRKQRNVVHPGSNNVKKVDPRMVEDSSVSSVQQRKKILKTESSFWLQSNLEICDSQGRDNYQKFKKGVSFSDEVQNRKVKQETADLDADTEQLDEAQYISPQLLGSNGKPRSTMSRLFDQCVEIDVDMLVETDSYSETNSPLSSFQLMKDQDETTLPQSKTSRRHNDHASKKNIASSTSTQTGSSHAQQSKPLYTPPNNRKNQILVSIPHGVMIEVDEGYHMEL